MGATIASLEDMIAPVAGEEFFSAYWEKQPLLVKRADSRFYDALLTLETVQNAISSGGLRYPALQLSKSGGFMPPEAFCLDIRSGGVVFSGVPDINRLQAEYRSGATLSLPGFHRAWKPLGTLAASVEDRLDHAVHTNIYITPPDSSGFSPHYDTHDVFVLQIAGGKRWKIFKPLVDLPHQSQPFHPQMLTASPPLLELDLASGDLLYLPRGFIHTTNTSEQSSAHVTLGVTVYTYVELLAAWLQSSKNDVGFRRALPAGFANRPELRETLKNEFSTLVAGLVQRFDADELVDVFLSRVREGYPGRNAVRSEFDAQAAIGLNSKIKALDQSRYSLKEESGNIVLKFSGKALVLPRQLRAMLSEMCARPSFTPGELSSDMKDDAKIALIRHLYKEGFLFPVK